MFLLHLVVKWDKFVPLNRQEKGQENRLALTFIFGSLSSEFMVGFLVMEHLHKEENLSLSWFFSNMTKVT